MQLFGKMVLICNLLTTIIKVAEGLLSYLNRELGGMDLAPYFNSSLLQ